jgi:hypothetical protein
MKAMPDLPAIRKKTRKPSYRKSEAVKHLEKLADANARRLHPACPHLALWKFRDDTTNGLTRCIVKYIELRGGFASRINNQGNYNQRLRKYIPGTSKRGLADIMATFRGLSLHIEVKHGRDVQSEAQKKVEAEVIASRGYYHLARNFTQFKQWFDNLNINKKS